MRRVLILVPVLGILLVPSFAYAGQLGASQPASQAQLTLPAGCQSTTRDGRVQIRCHDSGWATLTWRLVISSAFTRQIKVRSIACIEHACAARPTVKLARRMGLNDVYLIRLRVYENTIGQMSWVAGPVR